MILALGMVLDACLGEPRWLWNRLPHPAVLMGRAIGWCDARLNRGPAQKRNGILVIAALVCAAWLLGAVLSLLPAILEAILVAILLAQRALCDHVGDVARGLRSSLADGRAQVARIVGRDVATLDAAGIARAAIESAAENLSDGVIAPIIWYLIAGLPGLLAYKVINTADSMIGHRTPRHAQFGWAAARLDDLVNWLPARATALMMLARRGRFDLWPMVQRDARLHRSPNAGWPEAAMAGLLGLALSGPRSYAGVIGDEPYINAVGRRDAGPHDIDAAVAVLWQVWVMALGIGLILGMVAAVF